MASCHYYPTPQGPQANNVQKPEIPIMCICGTAFNVKPANLCYGGSGVICDLCSKTITKTDSVFHCPNEKNPAHDEGYDLCSECALKEIDETKMQMETEGGDSTTLYIPRGYISDHLNPPCICGQQLIQISADDAYGSKPKKGKVVCDLCEFQSSGSDPVFHCKIGKKSNRHEHGYDLCFECGWKYMESRFDQLAMTTNINDNEEDAALFAPGTAAHADMIQTEALIPLCICGEDLVKTDSTVYGPHSTVCCDNCSASCKGKDIVWHCPKEKDAAEHDEGFDLCDECARKQNKRVRTNWLSDLWQDLVVTIAAFIVRRRPSSIMSLKEINKHWYHCLDPNKPNVNAIWEHNVCRPMFPHIPKKLKVRRWDRFYQYRYSVILNHRKEKGDKTKINADRVYSKLKLIENCMHDVPAINAMYRDPLIIDESGGHGVNGDDDDGKEPFDGYFDGQIGSHGLPDGFEWTLECPVLALKLKDRQHGKQYCGVCKKNVYTVGNTEEMAKMVDMGECVQFSPRNKRRRGRVSRLVMLQ